MKLFTYIIFIITFPLAICAAEDIEEIKILNSDFKVIRTISLKSDLNIAFNEWNLLKPIKKLPNTNWTHKIDFKSKSIGGRWLYNKEGYVAKLNKKLKPIYKVHDIDSFNKIYLGL